MHTLALHIGFELFSAMVSNGRVLSILHATAIEIEISQKGNKKPNAIEECCHAHARGRIKCIFKLKVMCNICDDFIFLINYDYIHT